MLVGVDKDKRSLQALDFALDLYQHHEQNPDIHVLHVTPDMDETGDALVIEAARELIKNHDFPYDVTFKLVAISDVTDGSTISDVFLSYADRIEADHAFLGYPNKSVTSELFGASPRRAVQSAFRGGQVTIVKYYGDEVAAAERLEEDGTH